MTKSGKDISFLFHNGNTYNLYELVLYLNHSSADTEVAPKYVDCLACTYADLKEISIDFSNQDELKLYFAESCLAWALYYVYNMKKKGVYARELADLQSHLKLCVKSFIGSGLKSKGYWSKFHPHPDYNFSWRFPFKKSRYYKKTLKEYDNFIETAECSGKYFAGVLNMFIIDYEDEILPDATRLTQYYKAYLLNICAWIACSGNSRYYRQIVNNFIINYYYWYTSMDGKKPDFYQFEPRFAHQMQTEKNKCLMGMLDVEFCDTEILCKWIHYDVIFKKTDPHIEQLVRWMFGKEFPHNTSLRMKEIYKSLFTSMNQDLLENPGIVLLMYLGIQKISLYDFKDIFTPSKEKLQKNTNIDESFLSQFLQVLFYFMVWDICSAYKFRWENYRSYPINGKEPHILFKEREYNSFSTKTKKNRFSTWTNDKENLMANFYEPFLDGTWRNPKTLQHILNLFADFFKFNKKNPFDGLNFSELSGGKISIFETVPILIYNLSHGEASTYIINELNFIRKQYEFSLNVLPNTRKKFKSEAERAEVKKDCEKNLQFLKEYDVGFHLDEFEQSFYPFKQHSISLRRNCICKFLPETDSDIYIFNSSGKNCTLRIDKDRRFRSNYKNHFWNRYLYNDRNSETHYSSCTAINNLLGDDSFDKKFILSALFDIKKQLADMTEKENTLYQILQIKYLNKECDILFKIIVRKYFKSIPQNKEWEYIFNDNGEFGCPKELVSAFNDNFSALDFGYDMYTCLQEFFEIVWNIRSLYYDARHNDEVLYDADFFEIYKLPIELYIIYLSLSFQKYDGENRKQ
ncbi:hypothetical protein E4O05_03150 [Treponema sp. OMZ 787]|uniref:hypothetical protein n=1 Tax=Treponema sp. OMZ 787 TaxID=2563669 RepID=UPI0020A41F61|nr:hypothetical protein [Treponema sp. OMZ 787]UTC62907.1 hypothetical protein E4O05_03150 [Treponema sp. OMZ 787]